MIVQKLGGTDWKYRDIQEKEWHDANVPGTLFMDMIREGRIQNPFLSFPGERISGACTKGL